MWTSPSSDGSRTVGGSCARSPRLAPNRWFAAADEVDLGARLEALAITKALRRADELPDELRVSVNTSARHLAGLDRQPSEQAMVAATVSYAHRVGAKMVAEGIETVEELAALQGLEVDFGQGYLLARPAAAFLPSSVLPWLTQDRLAA